MRQLFLFGAGASNGSGPCHPESPALGKDLIDALLPYLHPGLRPIIHGDLLSAFRENFELGMDQFWRKHAIALPQFTRDMGFYFARFSPQSGNHYLRLIRALTHRRHRVVLSTLNYDMLIEAAINLNGYRVSWAGHQFWEPDKYTLLKLHGSCNFLPDLHGGSIRGMSFDIGPPQSGIRTGAVLSDSRPSRDMNEVRRFMREEDVLAPVMAAYHKDKPVFFGNPNMLDQWRREWAEFLQTADVLFVIGTALVEHDHHIWDHVARFKGIVEWVSRRHETAQTWCNRSGVRFNHMARNFGEFVVEYERRY